MRENSTKKATHPVESNKTTRHKLQKLIKPNKEEWEDNDDFYLTSISYPVIIGFRKGNYAYTPFITHPHHHHHHPV